MSISESIGSAIRSKKNKIAGGISAATLLVALSSSLPGVSHAWRLGQEIPDFAVNSTDGEFNIHEFIQNKGLDYLVLFSHPKDFTPVCTTELAAVHNLKPELDKLGAAALALSVDTLESHQEWAKDILAYASSTDEKLNFPIISDPDLEFAKKLDMLPADDTTEVERTAKTNQTVRTVFIIDSDKKIQWMMTAPMTTGRDFDHILWTLKSLKLTAKKHVATPANWKEGQEVVVKPGMSDEDAGKFLSDLRTVELPSTKTYLRFGKFSEEAVEEGEAGALNQDADDSQLNTGEEIEEKGEL